MAGKVVQDLVVRAEIQLLSFRGQGEEFVEFREYQGRRLVDGYQHCLAGIGEFPQVADNVGRAFGVQTRGWLVGKENPRSSRELDTNLTRITPG